MSAMREQIVDTALKLAEEQGWEAVRMADIADRLGIGLRSLSVYFREKDEIIDAWLDRADTAMLATADTPGWSARPTQERLRTLILTYLEALSGHRRVTREMIGHKLEFGHVHVQFPALLRISRTVQWIREGARREDTFFVRGLEETVLTSIFIATFLTWLRDEEGDARTRARLDWMLDRASGLAEAALPQLRRLPLPTLQGPI